MLELFVSLIFLALIDSTSFGTLIIPLWLLTVVGRVQPRRLLLYLGTIAAFYFLIGVVLVSGFSAAAEALEGLGDAEWLLWAQLVFGVGLFAFSFRFGGDKGDEQAAGDEKQPGRIARWHSRVREGNSGTGAIVVLALTSGAIEVATMLPYLGAVSLLGSSDLLWGEQLLVLAGYCVVMVVPALVLLGLRMAFEARMQPRLVRLEGWLSRNAAEATGWILAIVGFLMAQDAAQRLALFDRL